MTSIYDRPRKGLAYIYVFKMRHEVQTPIYMDRSHGYWTDERLLKVGRTTQSLHKRLCSLRGHKIVAYGLDIAPFALRCSTDDMCCVEKVGLTIAAEKFTQHFDFGDEWFLADEFNLIDFLGAIMDAVEDSGITDSLKLMPLSTERC